MNIPAPFSHYRYITPWAIFLSAVLTAALTLLHPGSDVMLWANWGMAGLMSFIIWNFISKFNLHGDDALRTYAISWPLLTVGLQFVYCHYPHDGFFYRVLLQNLALLLVINIMLSLWQAHNATSQHLLLGALIGLISSMLPHALLWLILLPIASFFMRSWSSRNILSGLTGAAIAVWLSYCALFLFVGSESAGQMLQRYAFILQDEDYSPLFSGLGYFQYLYLALVFLLTFFYGVSGLTLGVGQSTRSKSSIQLISTLSFVVALLLFLDVRHFFTSLSLLSLFIALQLTIHQANVKAIVHEWWIIIAIVGSMALCLLPFIVS